MATVTLVIEGITTLQGLADAVELAETAGFPPTAPVGSPLSGKDGARFSCLASLNLLTAFPPECEEGDS